MFIKKTTKDGFRNPKYDEWDKKAGIIAFILLLFLLGFLIITE